MTRVQASRACQTDAFRQEHDHLFKFPKDKAREVGLPEAIELYNDVGYGAYGLGVYHQMHCLNRIRKSFYPERYYPGESQHEVMHHTSTW